MIGSLGLDPTFTATRKRPDFDGGFGINGHSEDICGCIRFTIDLTQVVEDGVGLRNFF